MKIHYQEINESSDQKLEFTLTKKDQRALFAAMCLQGILANGSRYAYQVNIVDCAIAYADELIKKLEE
jgi:hypothetical protein